MPLILHIFKKDLRRLWPAVLIMLVLLAELARLDSWRNDWLTTSVEGSLSLLLPLLWACLIALLVQQESLVGDRQFWITWPYTWKTLLGSKVLLVLIFIHLPALLADAAILAAHGFQPGEYAWRLIWKQVMLGALLTAPALALSTLFENVTGFLLAAIGVAAAAAYVAGWYEPRRAPWVPEDDVRTGLVTLVIAVTASAIILIQYVRRRTAFSRITGAGAAVLAGLMFGYLPAAVTARIRSTLHPTSAPVSMRLLSSLPPFPAQLESLRTGQEIAVVALPLTISGISDSEEVRFNTLRAEMIGPGAQRYRMLSNAARRSFEKADFEVFIVLQGQRSSWLILRLRRSIMNDIKDGAVTIRAVFETNLHHAGQPAWMSVGAVQTVAGVGRCSSTVVESRNLYQESMLKVLCESPHPISSGTVVKLWQPETGGEWKQRLGDSAPLTLGPRGNLLSPLNRLQTFFHLVSDAKRYDGPGNRWLVPRAALENAKLSIAPDIATGWATSDFEIANIRLRDYVLQASR